MSYIDQSLGNGETVITRARFPWFYSLSAWSAFLVPLAVLVFLYWESSQHPTIDGATDSYRIGMYVVAAWLVYGLYTGIRMLVLRATNEIGVTSHRFVEKRGVFSMRTSEIALPNIEGVKVNQSVFGRIFNYGTVKIEGTGVDATTTPEIADPVGFVRAIQTAKEHVGGR